MSTFDGTVDVCTSHRLQPLHLATLLRPLLQYDDSASTILRLISRITHTRRTSASYILRMYEVTDEDIDKDTYAREQQPACEWGYEIIENAVRYGHLETVQYIIELEKEDSDTHTREELHERVRYVAACGRHKHIIE